MCEIRSRTHGAATRIAAPALLRARGVRSNAGHIVASPKTGARRACANHAMWHGARRDQKRHARGQRRGWQRPRCRGPSEASSKSKRPFSEELPAENREKTRFTNSAARASSDTARRAQQRGLPHRKPQTQSEARAKHAMWHVARQDHSGTQRGSVTDGSVRNAKGKARRRARAGGQAVRRCRQR